MYPALRHVEETIVVEESVPIADRQVAPTAVLGKKTQKVHNPWMEAKRYLWEK